MKKQRGILKKIFIAAFLSAVILAASGVAAFFFVTRGATLDPSRLSPYDINHNIVLYDQNDTAVKTRHDSSYVRFEDIPDVLVRAFIAVEDKRFFRHNGIDPLRILGALKNDIASHSLKEGASTIDQQLVKNSHLNAEKSIARKLKEVKLALSLDRKYKKEEILEIYLNSLYFGNGIYGVKSAARIFFDKELSALSPSECAAIAGVVKNPSGYSPLKNPKSSLSRRNLVLSLMRAEGYLSDEQTAAAQSEILRVTDKKQEETVFSSYAEAALDEAAGILHLSVKELLTSGCKIYTYYDEEKQRLLIDSVSDGSFNLKNENGKAPDAMSILADNHDGGINAFYVNGYIDNLNDFRRQPGSVIKPILVYAPAFRARLYSPASPVNDVKKSFGGGYSPSNFKDRYEGWTTVKSAVKNSSNVVAVEVLERLGVLKAKEFADELKLALTEEDKLNIALG
ncbi:MAG: transglycosylase domain-containing protein, partial [Clostridiales bacterium]|nr:transglycosylase domain-containing protein [Clostridiales bacterium]